MRLQNPFRIHLAIKKITVGPCKRFLFRLLLTYLIVNNWSFSWISIFINQYWLNIAKKAWNLKISYEFLSLRANLILIEPECGPYPPQKVGSIWGYLLPRLLAWTQIWTPLMVIATQFQPRGPTPTQFWTLWARPAIGTWQPNPSRIGLRD